jgi:hypothetical protein
VRQSRSPACRRFAAIRYPANRRSETRCPATRCVPHSPSHGPADSDPVGRDPVDRGSATLSSGRGRSPNPTGRSALRMSDRPDRRSDCRFHCARFPDLPCLSSASVLAHVPRATDAHRWLPLRRTPEPVASQGRCHTLWKSSACRSCPARDTLRPDEFSAAHAASTRRWRQRRTHCARRTRPQ